MLTQPKALALAEQLDYSQTSPSEIEEMAGYMNLVADDLEVGPLPFLGSLFSSRKRSGD